MVNGVKKRQTDQAAYEMMVDIQ